MRFLLKVLALNITAFVIFAIVIELITKDDWEGFAYAIYYIFALGLIIFVNLILTAIAAIQKNVNLKYYFAGLLLSFMFTGLVYIIID
jgi:hypothetical protein